VNTALRSDPITSTGSASQLVSLHLRNPLDYYSFNWPRRDGWLSWPCWLTDSGRFTHIVVTRPAVSLAQDRESSPARTGGLTTMLRHHFVCVLLWRHAFTVYLFTIVTRCLVISGIIFYTCLFLLESPVHSVYRLVSKVTCNVLNATLNYTSNWVV